MNKSLLTSLALVSFISGPAMAAEPYCPFAYQKVMHELVLPELNKKLGERASDFSVDDPLLLQSRNNLQVILQAGRSKAGGIPLDSDNFIVIIDTCAFKVIESRFMSTEPSIGRRW